MHDGRPAPTPEELARATSVGRVAVLPTEVLTVRPHGDLRYLTLLSTLLAGLVRPGHVLSLPGVDRADRVRRAVPVAGATTSGTYGGTVELLVAPEDCGAVEPGDRLELLGPLGRATPLPQEAVPVVVVGHGRGGGLATWLARLLADRGCRVDAVLCAPTSTLLADTSAARRPARSLAVHTDDGTAGAGSTGGTAAGLVAELAGRSGAAVVYAVGPVPWLLGVTEAGLAAGAVVQCVVDEPMPCVSGVCGACAVPVVDSEGQTVLARSCVEGPTLPGDRIRWDAVGPHGRRVPGDARPGRRLR